MNRLCCINKTFLFQTLDVLSLQCTLEMLSPDTGKVQAKEKRACWIEQVTSLSSAIENILADMNRDRMSTQVYGQSCHQLAQQQRYRYE